MQSFTMWEFRFFNSCHNSHKNTVKYSCLYEKKEPTDDTSKDVYSL